ncbi:hypothetical protein KKHLCK_16230 [Candidatus Electrothrix laxa]
MGGTATIIKGKVVDHLLQSTTEVEDCIYGSDSIDYNTMKTLRVIDANCRHLGAEGRCLCQLCSPAFIPPQLD